MRGGQLVPGTRDNLTCCPSAEDRQRAGHIRYTEAYHGWVLPLTLPVFHRYARENVVVTYCPWCGARLPEVPR